MKIILIFGALLFSLLLLGCLGQAKPSDTVKDYIQAVLDCDQTKAESYLSNDFMNNRDGALYPHLSITLFCGWEEEENTITSFTVESENIGENVAEVEVSWCMHNEYTFEGSQYERDECTTQIYPLIKEDNVWKIDDAAEQSS